MGEFRQTTMTLAESFDKEAESYDKDTATFHHQICNHVLLTSLLDELGGNKDLLILDSGGGTGNIALQLKRKGYDVSLSDISGKSVEIARRKFLDEGVDIPTRVCNSEETSFRDGTFDFVMLNGAVLSYSPNPRRLLAETNRILKNEGRIWFDFFNSLGWSYEIGDPRSKVEMALSDDVLIKMDDWDYPARVFSTARVREMLRVSGFSIKAEMGLISLSHTLPLEIRYTSEYDRELCEKYKEKELTLSKSKESLGASWSCMFCAIKNK
jgi:ubiquinone/menaquinone biosynthesis C-methylase UbiE